jgi:hypothetical protein
MPQLYHQALKRAASAAACRMHRSHRSLPFGLAMLTPFCTPVSAALLELPE